MDQTADISPEPDSGNPRPKSSSRVTRKKMQRTRSFVDALREKYCSQDNDNQCDFVIDIVIRGRPRNNGPTSAELAHLRNIVLSNRRVSTGGLPENGLVSVCPNVTDLDLSSNLFESWAELLPLLSQLQHLKFVNLSRNHITRHKEELWRWSTPLPKVENLVLNSTGVPLREVLALARLMPALRELHICCNYYRDLGSVELAINDGALSKLECLRLNENIITSWAEVWKLRNMPCLTQLILSENPLCDIAFDPNGQQLDNSLCEMDSPNITCHSDGEDSSVGSPHFRYPVTKMLTPARCKKELFPKSSSDEHNPTSDQQTDDSTPTPHPETSRSSSVSQVELVSDVLEDIISHAYERVSIQESCHQCSPETNENASKVRADTQTEQRTAQRCQNDNETNMHVGRCLSEENEGNVDDNRPQFYLEDAESDAVCRNKNENFCEQEEKEQENAEDEQNKNTPQKEEDRREEDTIPFAKLHMLCLSRTSICELDHLHALNEFPELRALKIMDIALFSEIHQEDRRKLFVASLPKVQALNGSEVTSIEREKAERHYLRHFLEASEKPARYMELEEKHGPVQPLFDIDLGARFQKEVTLTFMLTGVKKFTERVSMLQTVQKLRCFVARKLGINRHSFRMFHFACGPYQNPADQTIDELFLDSLPLSRFDFMNGDELHVEFETSCSQPVQDFLTSNNQQVHNYFKKICE
ncbi:uncharacterized protein [Littorina saxatilis]|uniref:Uncharacterized protein n=1 Tax=Littorina saxatilis TaxID=31220 RepID=A0AAN9G1H8_9CAEN